jgi:phosphoribosylformimino-5-aminoimidazole carboxamide ribonucleotide (ProFAR) isomerase
MGYPAPTAAGDGLPTFLETIRRVASVLNIPLTAGGGIRTLEDARAVVVFAAEQERTLLEACAEWQFPLFLTLLLTGLRPGELVHLLLPEDLDLGSGWLRIRNPRRISSCDPTTSPWHAAV